MYKELSAIEADDDVMPKLITDVMIRVANGVSKESVEHSMFIAFRRLCGDSEALVYRCEQTLSASLILYSLVQSNIANPADFSVDVLRLKSVKVIPPDRVGKVSFEEVEPLPAYTYSVVNAGQLKFNVELFDPRKMDGGLLQTDTALTIPRADGRFIKEFVHDCTDAFVFATCVELFGQVGRPWFSGDLMQYYESRYQHELSIIYNKTDTENKNTCVDVMG